jgi:hypothetical protein
MVRSSSRPRAAANASALMRTRSRSAPDLTSRSMAAAVAASAVSVSAAKRAWVSLTRASLCEKRLVETPPQLRTSWAIESQTAYYSLPCTAPDQRKFHSAETGWQDWRETIAVDPASEAGPNYACRIGSRSKNPKAPAVTREAEKIGVAKIQTRGTLTCRGRRFPPPWSVENVC